MRELGRVSLLRLTNDLSEDDATFALGRPLYLYTLADPPSARPLVEHALEAEAQRRIVEIGVYPASETDGTEP
ncbi:MAG: hypothetical protein AB1Z65_07680 [Candidatus Sulfomarinibacteraceae bacterium]